MMCELKWDTGCRPWLAASNDDTRPILMRVLLDARGFLVATNCHLLAIVKAEVPAEYDQAMLPASFFAAAAKHRAKIFLNGETACFDTNFGAVSTRILWPDKDSQFPPWTRVIPSIEAPVPNATVRLNPEYIATIHRVFGNADGLSFAFSNSELGTVLFTAKEHRGSFVLLMPMSERAQPGEESQTSFARLAKLISKPDGA